MRGPRGDWRTMGILITVVFIIVCMDEFDFHLSNLVMPRVII